MDRVMMNEGSKDHAVDAAVVVGQTEESHCPSQHCLPNCGVVISLSEAEQQVGEALESQVVLRH